ncbi:DUF5107 domain-containing protein [Kribbella sp. NBC_01245]|uniref:DUF5107 domain-containing protein n=1 Tax=Kribbella sp. NBC_01245 TaxID=2903578 RepID=UPI002E27BD99|nr:DUF5107 domain-containing protein [Kribbella sp. NBC_01245]
MTTRLFPEDLVLPVAALGPENPLPPLRSVQELHDVENLDELPQDLRDNVQYGRLHSVLPCLEQDGHGRTRVEEALPALVLENDFLRATVLPGLGGRLYSLVDKTFDQELLYRNPVLQPANLALRNAWFAGGVEWNLGSTGHWTGTCSPMHAAQVEGPDGSPMLRLWEWERSRGLVVQLDFWLPNESDLLYVGVRIQNPSDQVVPVYWWSNIAVEQSPGTRVVAPADQAWRFGYGSRLDLVDVPQYDGFDLTYPMQHRRAVDFFFELPPEQRPWIASLDASGTGLVQLSTERLRGRKLFVWGESEGGRRWQEWLAPGMGGDGYAEIQAGLARTQMEHLPLPAETSWSWLEAYGRLEVDPEVVHADDWSAATAGVDAVCELRLSATDLAERYDRWLAVADGRPGEALFTGSGWGALEIARTDWKVSPGTPFAEDSQTDRELAWLPLLQGRLPETDPLEAPDGTLVAWASRLEQAADNWLVWYHRGVARWYDGKQTAAVEAWQQSLELAESPWALRNLAVAYLSEGRTDDATTAYLRAVELVPDNRPLAIEALDVLGTSEEAAALLDRLPADIRQDPRVLLAEARQRLARGDAKGAESLLAQGIELPGLREGANQLAEIWRSVQTALGTDEPVPPAYNFGMFEN